jgi:hypothetical protein
VEVVRELAPLGDSTVTVVATNEGVEAVVADITVIRILAAAEGEVDEAVDGTLIIMNQSIGKQLPRLLRFSVRILIHHPSMGPVGWHSGVPNGNNRNVPNAKHATGNCKNKGRPRNGDGRVSCRP